LYSGSYDFCDGCRDKDNIRIVNAIKKVGHHSGLVYKNPKLFEVSRIITPIELKSEESEALIAQTVRQLQENVNSNLRDIQSKFILQLNNMIEKDEVRFVGMSRGIGLTLNSLSVFPGNPSLEYNAFINTARLILEEKDPDNRYLITGSLRQALLQIVEERIVPPVSQLWWQRSLEGSFHKDPTALSIMIRSK
jgi:hypothetical protein